MRRKPGFEMARDGLFQQFVKAKCQNGYFERSAIWMSPTERAGRYLRRFEIPAPVTRRHFNNEER